jgi:hypothetical protein
VGCAENEIEAGIESDDGDNDNQSWNKIDKEADAVAGEPAPWVSIIRLVVWVWRVWGKLTDADVAVAYDRQTDCGPENGEEPRENPDDAFVFLDPG